MDRGSFSPSFHNTFSWQAKLVPFGILNTENDQLSIYIGESAETSDFIIIWKRNQSFTWWVKTISAFLAKVGNSIQMGYHHHSPGWWIHLYESLENRRIPILKLRSINRLTSLWSLKYQFWGLNAKAIYNKGLKHLCLSARSFPLSWYLFYLQVPKMEN